MCGLVGVITGKENSYCLPDITKKMSEKIAHRGPDSSGLFFDQDLSFSFAHQRLSILDLSKSGNQPMESFRQRYIIAFNGEIYNFIELKKKLTLETVIEWKGTSDTEVLLNCIEYWGLQKTLELTRGMFAFALLDKFKKRLILVRDRFGEKPMYWGFTGEGSAKALIFGSEINALREFPSFNNAININALDPFLKFSNIPDEQTIFKSIWKLKPANKIEFKLDKDIFIDTPRSIKWWDYKKVINYGIQNQFTSKKEVLNHLEETLRGTIQSHNISDVPTGTFLSGGIDSSLVATFLSQSQPNKVNTFTIGFEDQKYDESKDASNIAKYLGTKHNEIILNPLEALNLIPKLPYIYSEPFADSSQVPTSLICREVSNAGIKVALTGDGGDEMFGGYVRHFKGPRSWNKIKYIPYPLRSLIGSIIKGIPIQEKNLNELTKSDVFSQKIIRIASRLKEIRDHDGLYKSLIMQKIDNSIYSKDILINFDEPFSNYYSHINKAPDCLSNDPIARMLYWDAISYLPDDILVKVDRASMAFSLETRAPFLDKTVAELAWKIPTDMKVRGGEGKLVLKELLYKYLPKELVDKPKRGFAFPVSEWLRGPLKEWSEELLSMDNLLKYNHFSSNKVRSLWKDHLNSKSDNTNILWPILMWQSWLKFYKF